MSAPNRNDPCPCGSGKKYKKCCLANAASQNSLVQSGKSQRHDVNPRNAAPPSALLMRAVSLHQAGMLDEAEAAYQSLLKNNPSDGDALHYLGLIAFQRHRYPDAINLIEAAIKINRKIAAFHCNLGNAYKASGLFDKAIAAFFEAVRLDPQFHAAYCNLGNTYLEQGSLDNAVASYRKAILLRQDFAEAHGYLGVALQEQGRLQEAREHYQKALAVNPRHADAYSGLASLYFELGQFEDAQLALSKALEIQPGHPIAWATMTRLRKMTAADTGWLDQALSLTSPANSILSARESINLRFAIGKYYDDTGQYDFAFESYCQANMLQRQREGGFDRAGFSRLVDTLIAVYTADVATQIQAGASLSRRPVLIVGMPRSGTSLIEQIIASHPDAVGAGELSFWDSIARTNQASAMSGSYTPALIAGIAAAYEQLLQQYSREATRVVDKMPNNFMWLGLINAVFPQARIIHAQRNPIDTCLSIYFQSFSSSYSYGTDFGDLAFYYREYERLMQHWRTVLPADQFLEVSYEALIDDQAAWSQRIVEFVGLEWDERCLEFHKTERIVGTASSWQVRQKIYRTSKARWRNYEGHLGSLLDLNSGQS